MENFNRKCSKNRSYPKLANNSRSYLVMREERGSNSLIDFFNGASQQRL